MRGGKKTDHVPVQGGLALYEVPGSVRGLRKGSPAAVWLQESPCSDESLVIRREKNAVSVDSEACFVHR